MCVGGAILFSRPFLTHNQHQYRHAYRYVLLMWCPHPLAVNNFKCNCVCVPGVCHAVATIQLTVIILHTQLHLKCPVMDKHISQQDSLVNRCDSGWLRQWVPRGGGGGGGGGGEKQTGATFSLLHTKQGLKCCQIFITTCNLWLRVRRSCGG